MSRTSTTNSSSTSASHPKPSPPSTIPSLTPQTSYASASTPFSPSNAIDDFVLFPEDSWNTDMSLAGLESQDLGDFNFDLNDLNQYNDPAFNFSFDQQLSNFSFDNNLGHTPLMADQYGLDQWASPIGGDTPVHTRPHPSGPSRDSGGLDTSFQTGWLHDVPTVSPMIESYAQGSLLQPQPFQNTTAGASPLSSSSSDWSILEASVFDNSPAPQGDAGTPASSQSQSSDGSQIRTKKRRAADEDSPESTLPLANQRGSASGIEVDPSDLPKPGGLDRPSFSSSNRETVSARRTSQVPPSDLEQLPSETPPSQLAAFANICQSASSVLQRLSSASVEAASLSNELQRLQAVLQQVSETNADMSGTSGAQLQTLSPLLRTISDAGQNQSSSRRYNKLDPELRPDYLRECQIQARRVVRSLCATINNVEAQNNGTLPPTDGPMLTSGRNVHLFASEAGTQPLSTPASLSSGVGMWVESTSYWQLRSRHDSSYGSTPGATNEGSQPTAGSANSEGCTGYSLQPELNLLGNPSADGPLPSTIAQGPSLLQDRQAEAFASPSLFFNRSLDNGVQVHRYRSYGLENSATSDQARVYFSSSSDPLPGVIAEAGNDRVQSPLEVVASSGYPLVSQFTQTNAAAPSMVQNAQSPQDSPLVVQTNDVFTPREPLRTAIASHQTQSSTAYQLVLTLLATLFASCIVCRSLPFTSDDVLMIAF
jgi:hypothetical protein